MITKEKVQELLIKAPEDNPEYFLAEMSYQQGVIDTYDKLLKEYSQWRRTRREQSP